MTLPCIADIASYLIGRTNFHSLQIHAVSPSEVAPDQMLCHVSERREILPQCKVTSINEPGRIGAITTIPYSLCATFFLSPITDLQQSGVFMQVLDGKLHFGPVWKNMNYSYGCFLRIDSKPVEVLCRLTQITIKRLDFFKPTVEWVHEGVHGYIHDHVSHFNNDLTSDFFSSDHLARAWHIASNWPQWELDLTPSSERMRQLRESLGITTADVDLNNLHPSATLAGLKRERDPLKASTAVARLPEVNITSFAMEKASVPLSRTMDGPRNDRTALKWPTNFSNLGSTSSPSESDFASSGIWWWRRLYAQGTRKELEWFSTKAETSAFYYELHARRHVDKSSLPKYAFGSPWCELSTTERSIISLFWPCEVCTSITDPIRQWNSIPDRLKFRQTVDFAQPLADLLDEVKERWRQMEPDLIKLWGELIPSRTKAKASLLKRLTRKAPDKWRLLEALDLNNACGSYQLNRQEKITLARQRKRYEAACLICGISP